MLLTILKAPLKIAALLLAFLLLLMQLACTLLLGIASFVLNFLASLFLAGAVAGIISGGLTVIIWDYIPLVAGQTLGSYTGLYSLAVGFAVSLIMIIVFSLATKEPSKEITDVFDKVAGKN